MAINGKINIVATERVDRNNLSVSSVFLSFLGRPTADKLFRRSFQSDSVDRFFGRAGIAELQLRRLSGAC